MSTETPHGFMDVLYNGISARYDDDPIDRLNNQRTPFVMLLAATAIYAKQFLINKKNIECWLPAQFTSFWEEYAEGYCFVQQTYYVPLERSLQTDERRPIGYYQWVPVVLAIQAVAFHIPSLVWWVAASRLSGLSVKGLLSMARQADNVEGKGRMEAMTVVAGHLEEAIRIKGTMKKTNYLTFWYFCVKIIYIVQCIGQFWMLNRLLSPSYTLWGFGILADVLRGRTWKDSGHFPRVTMCDFQIRELGQIHNYTIQCVLALNMFIEKLYLFLWWWMLAVGVMTVGSLVLWIGKMFFGAWKKAYIVNFIEAYDGLFDRDNVLHEALLDRFVDERLGLDGVLLIRQDQRSKIKDQSCRLIATNVGDILATDLLAILWNRMLERERENEQKKRGLGFEGFLQTNGNE